MALIKQAENKIAEGMAYYDQQRLTAQIALMPYSAHLGDRIVYEERVGVNRADVHALPERFVLGMHGKSFSWVEEGLSSSGGTKNLRLLSHPRVSTTK
jgi:hypothetical protein